MFKPFYVIRRTTRTRLFPGLFHCVKDGEVGGGHRVTGFVFNGALFLVRLVCGDRRDHCNNIAFGVICVFHCLFSYFIRGYFGIFTMTLFVTCRFNWVPGALGGTLTTLGKVKVPQDNLFGVTSGRFVGTRYINTMLVGCFVKVGGVTP